MQLTAPVATHGNQRPRGSVRNRLRPPDLAQNDVHESGASVDEPLDGLLREEACLQLLMRMPEQLAVSARRALGFRQKDRKSA